MTSKVLFILPLMEFIIFEKYKSSLRFSHVGGNMITTMLTQEGYECDYYDIDARAIKKLDHISEFFDTEKEVGVALKNYLKGIKDEHAHKIDRFLEVADELIPNSDYEYIMCSLPCYGNSTNDYLHQSFMAGIFLRHYRNKNKGAKTLLGGGWCDRISLSFWEKQLVDLRSLADILVTERVTRESISSILNLGKGKTYEPFIFAQEVRNKLGFIYGKPNTNLDKQDFLMNYVEEDSFRNREDLSYTYEEIFNRYDLKIPNAEYANKEMKMGSLYFTEGCIAECGFCEVGAQRLTVMPLTKIQDRIKYYVYDLGYTNLFFKNTAFNPTRSFSDKLCNWMINENLNIYWSDSARFTEKDQGFYDMLFESGCRSMAWGCEVFSDRMLKYINKGPIGTEEICNGVQMSHKAGIWNIMNFVVGMPKEEKQDIKANIDFIQSYQYCMDEVHLDPYELKPNSPFVLTPEKFGLVRNEEGKSNLLDPDKNLTSSQTFSYRRKVRDIAMSYLMNLKRVHYHIPHTMLFPAYDMMRTKEDTRTWFLKNYEPYRLSGFREVSRNVPKEDRKDYATHHNL